MEKWDIMQQISPAKEKVVFMFCFNALAKAKARAAFARFMIIDQLNVFNRNYKVRR